MAELPWEPKLDAQQTRDMVMQYRMRPALWDDKEDDIKEIERHAHAHRIPFARTEDHQDNAIVTAIKQFGMGWGEGFTTVVPEKLGFGAEPETQWDAIARSLGHLAGFVGYIPGGKAFNTIRALNMVTRGKSVPMRVAKKAEDALKKRIKPAMESANPQLLASLWMRDNVDANYVGAIESIIVDNKVINQDIYVTHVETVSTEQCNFYLELEEMKLSIDEATVATLKDMRGSE